MEEKKIEKEGLRGQIELSLHQLRRREHIGSKEPCAPFREVYILDPTKPIALGRKHGCHSPGDHSHFQLQEPSKHNLSYGPVKLTCYLLHSRKSEDLIWDVSLATTRNHASPDARLQCTWHAWNGETVLPPQNEVNKATYSGCGRGVIHQLPYRQFQPWWLAIMPRQQCPWSEKPLVSP
eukprot:1160864-Pelagomonas_calceolata.AAC.5